MPHVNPDKRRNLEEKGMEKMSPRRNRVLVGALYALVITIVMLGDGRQGIAQAPDNANIIGTWNVTSDPGTPDEQFHVALVNEGGTASIVGADLERAEGAWIKTGRRTFLANLHGFENDGNRFLIRVTIQLVDKNSFTATTTTDLLNLDGTLVQAGIEFGTLQGTRMLMVPE